ncbi:MAG: 30S ribosomal protein S4 [Planctomycetota bacterium]
MSRLLGPSCRLCRREGIKLYLKGTRCFSAKCPVTKRKTAPGMHFWRGGKKMSKYGVQFREKQKIKRFYGILEGPFLRLFHEAERRKGHTGENLLVLLEERLDNVAYLLGYAASRKQARQLIHHGHIVVSGKRVDVPSYLVKVGDIIIPYQHPRSQELIKTNLASYATRFNSAWLELDKDTPQAKVLRFPTREETSSPVQEQLVVELCSR